MKKRLQIFASNLGFGGIEREIIILSNSLVNIYDIELVFLNRNESVQLDIDKKIKINVLGINSINIFNNNIIKDTLNRFKPDTIISTESLFNKYILKYESGRKVYWEHNHHDNSRLDNNSIMSNAKGFDRIIVPNKELFDLYKRYNENVSLIPNAITKLPNIVTDYSSNNIIFVGKLEMRKNIIELLKVFINVYKKCSDSRLFIIGNGSERKNIDKFIKDNKLSGIVTLYGELNTDEISNIYKDARVFVSCSQSESFGRSLVEAMSYAVPSVVYNCNDTFNEIVDDDINGYLIENHDINKMSEVILNLLKDRELSYSIGSCGREKASTYDINNMKTEWIKNL